MEAVVRKEVTRVVRNKEPSRAYEDMEEISYPFDLPQQRMDRASRAAQFAPYKALTGYEDMVVEKARLTDPRGELDEGTLEILNSRLNLLMDCIDQHPEVTVTYFVRDAKKTGGSYRTVSERIVKLDNYDRMLITASRRTIPIDDIFALSGRVFDQLEQTSD